MSQLIAVACHPCGRAGVWAPDGSYVVHEHPDGTTSACQTPPRDLDRFTARQRAALDAAIQEELDRRRIGAAA